MQFLRLFLGLRSSVLRAHRGHNFSCLLAEILPTFGLSRIKSSSHPLFLATVISTIYGCPRNRFPRTPYHRFNWNGGLDKTYIGSAAHELVVRESLQDIFFNRTVKDLWEGGRAGRQSCSNFFLFLAALGMNTGFMILQYFALRHVLKVPRGIQACSALSPPSLRLALDGLTHFHSHSTQ
jgi:hypothetical protein